MYHRLMYFDSFIEKTVLFLFFIHVDIVFLGIPNFSDVALFAVPFSVSRMIFTFALLRFCLTADILRLNQILFCDPIMLFFIHIYIKCNIWISKIERFSCILCCRRALGGKVRDRERKICQEPKYLLEIWIYWRQGVFKVKREK